jgi:hypothetical protein
MNKSKKDLEIKHKNNSSQLTQRILSKDLKWERQEVCERVGGVSQVRNGVLCVLYYGEECGRCI